MARRLRFDRLSLAFLVTSITLAASSSADDALPPVPPSPVVPAEPVTPAVAPAPTNPSLGRSFDTPEAAGKALFDAIEANDVAALRAIMGAGNEDLIEDGKDPVVAAQRLELAAAAKAKVSYEKLADGRMTVVVGRTEYPLAIPLVSKDGAWRFDAAAGRDELLARRIGEHELEAIGICLAYADAQVEYASKDRNGDGVKEYAQLLASTPSKQDGLYWESSDDEEQSPAGPGLTPFREATAPDATPSAPFNGYTWRVLTAQGENAPGGAYSYVINGRMIAGFALLAVPAAHRNSGVMSFLVSNQGKVYQKDLGPETLKLAAAIEAMNPDSTWTEVDDATLRAAANTSPDDAPFADKDGPVETATAPGSAGATGSAGSAGSTPVRPMVPCPQK